MFDLAMSLAFLACGCHVPHGPNSTAIPQRDLCRKVWSLVRPVNVVPHSCSCSVHLRKIPQSCRKAGCMGGRFNTGKVLARLLLELNAATAFRTTGRPRLRASLICHAAAGSHLVALDPRHDGGKRGLVMSLGAESPREVPSQIETRDDEEEKLRNVIASLKAEVVEKDKSIVEKERIIKSMRNGGQPAIDKNDAKVDAKKLSPDAFTAFIRELSDQPATEAHGSVEFMKYNDKYLKSPIKGNPLDREVMLYIPGLDFAGVSGCGSFPGLAPRYELWRCRVKSDSRSTYSDLAIDVVDFVTHQISRGKNVTLMGESFGGLLAVGVALRLVKEYSTRGANKSGLAGVILVNPATSYERGSISLIGPALTTVPAKKFALPFLPDVEVVRERTREQAKPQLSLYSIVAGSLLAASVPSVPQYVSGIQALLGDVLSPPSSTGSFPVPADVNALANRAASALVGLDSLASRLDPTTLSWRLQNWLARGCLEVDSSIRKLKDRGVPFLVLAGDQDRLLPSVEEAKRLERILGGRTCQSVVLKSTGHAALDDRLDLLKIIDDSPLWN